MQTSTVNTLVLIFFVIPVLGFIVAWVTAIRINTRNMDSHLDNIERVLTRLVDAYAYELQRKGYHKQSAVLHEEVKKAADTSESRDSAT